MRLSTCLCLLLLLAGTSLAKKSSYWWMFPKFDEHSPDHQLESAGVPDDLDESQKEPAQDQNAVRAYADQDPDLAGSEADAEYDDDTEEEDDDEPSQNDTIAKDGESVFDLLTDEEDDDDQPELEEDGKEDDVVPLDADDDDGTEVDPESVAYETKAEPLDPLADAETSNGEQSAAIERDPSTENEQPVDNNQDTTGDMKVDGPAIETEKQNEENDTGMEVADVLDSDDATNDDGPTLNLDTSIETEELIDSDQDQIEALDNDKQEEDPFKVDESGSQPEKPIDEKDEKPEVVEDLVDGVNVEEKDDEEEEEINPNPQPMNPVDEEEKPKASEDELDGDKDNIAGIEETYEEDSSEEEERKEDEKEEEARKESDTTKLESTEDDDDQLSATSDSDGQEADEEDDQIASESDQAGSRLKPKPAQDPVDSNTDGEEDEEGYIEEVAGQETDPVESSGPTDVEGLDHTKEELVEIPGIRPEPESVMPLMPSAACDSKRPFSLSVTPKSVVQEPGTDALLLCQLTPTDPASPLPSFHVSWIFQRSKCPKDAQTACAITLNTTIFEGTESANETYVAPYALLKMNESNAGNYTCVAEIRGCPSNATRTISQTVNVRLYTKPNYGVHLGVISAACVILLAILAGLFTYVRRRQAAKKGRYQELLSNTDLQYVPTKVLDPPNAVYNPTTTGFIRMSANSSFSSKSSFTSNEQEEA